MNTHADANHPETFNQLARRIAEARVRVAHQNDPALTEAYTDEEMAAEQELAQFQRRLVRDRRRAEAKTEAAAAARVRRTGDAIAKIELRDELTAARAVVAHRRATSPAGQLAGLHRYRVWAGRGLGGVVVVGMGWSAVNVQHNIAPAAALSDPLYWFSYGIEAMISVCLVIVMAGAPRLAQFGVTVSRRTLTGAEVALLMLTVALNTYPHVRDARWFDAGVHAVAPGMIAIALVIHHAMSTRVATAMSNAVPAAAAPASVRTPAPARRAPAAPASAPTSAPASASAAPASGPTSAPAPAKTASASATPAPTSSTPASAPSTTPAPAPAVAQLAAELIATGVIRVSASTAAAVITAADAQINAGQPRPQHTSIANTLGVDPRTVKRIITAAAQLRGAGARVIPLHQSAAAQQP